MNERYEGQTYYELLEVTPKAGPTEIYNAYQRARTTYSPNSPALYSMFTPQEAQELMALIEEAYQTLSHQARRRDYDQKLGLVEPKAAGSDEKHRVKRVDDPWVGAVKFQPKSKDALPVGNARTKFSVYKIEPEIERELTAIEECNGEFLKRIRVYKGVSIEQMSDEIRVTKATLAALEGNNLNALPVAVFTRGFVIQFARVLGLDEQKIANAYMKFFKARKVGS